MAEMTDDLGGYPERWGVGSCFENEGRFLYQAVCEMRPEVIVEVGRLHGCSTSHLALGCKHNGKGRVYSIDINEAAGDGIPPDLLPWISLWNGDVFAFDQEQFSHPIDILLEDGAHTTGFTEKVLRMFRPCMSSNGKIIVHDFKHWDCVKTVHDESIRVLGEPDEVFFEPPSDCGYGIWNMGSR